MQKRTSLISQLQNPKFHRNSKLVRYAIASNLNKKRSPQLSILSPHKRSPPT
ncbi:hypothetical protein APA_1061 [Pseudanabaena sp. lw0831]|nr:hypothetical protein APA_1061 [Pseudanabaena sp. lw0831]